jgi:hypothetical protein
MVGIATAIDYSIFFHNLRHSQADERMLVEVGSSWAGDEIGFVTEQI